MPHKNVVHLGPMRAMLAEWEQVRKHILEQKIIGFQVCLLGSTGKETVYLGGEFRASPQKAIKATLKIAAAGAKAAEDSLHAPALARI